MECSTESLKLMEHKKIVKKWRRKQSKRQRTRMWEKTRVQLFLSCNINIKKDRLGQRGQSGGDGWGDCWQRRGMDWKQRDRHMTYMWTRMTLLSRRSRLSLWTLNVTRAKTRGEMFAIPSHTHAHTHICMIWLFFDPTMQLFFKHGPLCSQSCSQSTRRMKADKKCAWDIHCVLVRQYSASQCCFLLKI